MDLKGGAMFEDDIEELRERQKLVIAIAKQLDKEGYEESAKETWYLASRICESIAKLTTEATPVGILARISAVTCAMRAGDLYLAIDILRRLKNDNNISSELEVEIWRIISPQDPRGTSMWWLQ